MLVDITTASGFTCQLDDVVFDDIELLELFQKMEKGDMMAVSAAITKILDDDTKAKLYDHIRKDDGRVPYADVAAEIFGMIEQIGKAKN